MTSGFLVIVTPDEGGGTLRDRRGEKALLGAVAELVRFQSFHSSFSAASMTSDVVADTNAVDAKAFHGGPAHDAAPVIRESGIPVGVELLPLSRCVGERLVALEVVE